MDLLSSNDLLVKPPPSKKPFSQLDIFAQQLCSSGPQLGQVVHYASTNIATYLSRTASGREQDTGKFNFGMGTEGVDSKPEVPQIGEAARSLFWKGGESP